MTTVSVRSVHTGSRSRLRDANARRNTAAGIGRMWRWRHARDAAWALLDRHIAPDATVAVVGAGNGHDLPLVRLGRRAGRLDLVDVDTAALRRAWRRLRLAGAPAEILTADVTAGRADAIIAEALADRTRPGSLAPRAGSHLMPLVRGRYDVIVADLVLSQLLYPALCDAGLPACLIDRTLRDHGQALTDRVIADLVTAAVPGGVLICIEDVLGWWVGHEQPFALDELLDDAALHPDNALRRGQQGRLAYGCDGRVALAAAGARTVDRACWRWPFAPGTDYLVCATVARVG
jgi:hypothetical protein